MAQLSRELLFSNRVITSDGAGKSPSMGVVPADDRAIRPGLGG
jgi:hypothetical protein